MHLSRIGLAAVLVATGLAVGASDTPPADAAPGREATYVSDTPDPHVIRVRNRYYSYSTNRTAPWGGLIHVPVMSSTDLTTWDGLTDALPNLPAWATAGRTWAPAVVRDGEGYTLFYSATHRGSGRQCIGRARSSAPTGPFVDRRVGPIVCQVSMGGSIDPYVFRNRDGARYLYWKNDGNCCGHRVSLWGQRLSTNEDLTGRPHRLISYDQAWERPLIENPAMTRSPDQGGEYRLFYAANWYDSRSYATGYARCSRPLGPCRKATTGGPWHATTDFAYGPGGAAFFTDTAGRNWMALHGWARPPDRIGYGNGGRRSLFIEKVDFSTGRPRVNTTFPYGWHRNAPHPFVDVPVWANAALSWAWNQRVVIGFDDAPDRRFRPDWAMTRGDAGALLRRSDPPGPVTRLTQGDQPLTRGQAARLLYTAAGSPNVRGTAFDHPLTDVGRPPALRRAVRWMVHDPDGAGPASSVAAGYSNNRFGPEITVSRANYVRMLHRFHTDA